MTEKIKIDCVYSKEQIGAGLKLAQEWYEGWKFDEIGADQLIEAIEKAQMVI